LRSTPKTKPKWKGRRSVNDSKGRRDLTEQEDSKVLPFKRPNPKNIAFQPMPGYTHNPLLKLSRNMLCPCLSGKKFKACCLGALPRLVTVREAEIYSEAMLKPDLVFQTPANKEKLEKLAATLLNANP
jgi:hypothetical protein